MGKFSFHNFREGKHSRDFVYFLLPGMEEVYSLHLHCQRFSTAWKTEFELEGINSILPSPELEILEIQSRFPLEVMKGKFVKNIEVPINIFISTCKNPLDEAMWKVERAELLPNNN